ncbi:MAG: sporulation protein YjcZ [Bacilli bacterium]|nr:sporulation protein YjcZ [Bacilli bacterium]
MSCTNTCSQTSCSQPTGRGCGFVTIIVLYILLAIILSSFVC